MQHKERIRELNDTLRQKATGGQIVLTQGIACQSRQDIHNIMCLVRDFTDFHADNDPFEEHDFGSFTYSGEKYFWKIDYYDLTRTRLSDDPSNPDITIRVMTVMP